MVRSAHEIETGEPVRAVDALLDARQIDGAIGPYPIVVAQPPAEFRGTLSWLPCSLAPHAELVASRIAEVEPPATRELEDRRGDRAACRFDSRQGVLECIGFRSTSGTAVIAAWRPMSPPEDSFLPPVRRMSRKFLLRCGLYARVRVA